MDPSLIASFSGLADSAKQQVASGLQAGIGAAQVVSGFVGKGKANRELKALDAARPKYSVSKTVKDNHAMAESMAGTGLSDEALRNYQQFSERGLTASLETLVRGGAGLNAVGDVYGSFQTGVQRTAVMDDEMRYRSNARLFEQNSIMGGELDKVWQMNTWAPWADKKQATVQKLDNYKRMIKEGTTSIVGAVANSATSSQYQQQANSVYGPGTTGEQFPSLDYMRTGPNPGAAAVMDRQGLYGRTTPTNNAISYDPDIEAIKLVQSKFPGLFAK